MPFHAILGSRDVPAPLRRFALASLLAALSLGLPDKAWALADAKFDLGRGDTYAHLGAGFACTMAGAELLRWRGVPPARATALASLLTGIGGVFKEFAYDDRASGNDIIADGLGTGLAASIRFAFPGKSRQPNAAPKAAKPPGETPLLGLDRHGEHLEMQALYSPLRGGDAGVEQTGGGAAVEGREYSADLAGFAARYYLSDPLFLEASGLMLTRPVEVGTYRSSSGSRHAIVLTRYSPFDLGLGWKFFDRWGMRASTKLGGSVTVVRGEVRPLSADAAASRIRGSRQLIGGWAWEGEVQWIPAPWMGLGVRGGYHSKGRYDLVSSVAADRWRFSVELLTGF